MGQTRPDPGKPDAHDREARASVEGLMDEILEQSFPASDAPAWGVVRARVEQMPLTASSGAPLDPNHRGDTPPPGSSEGTAAMIG